MNSTSLSWSCLRAAVVCLLVSCAVSGCQKYSSLGNSSQQYWFRGDDAASLVMMAEPVLEPQMTLIALPECQVTGTQFSTRRQALAELSDALFAPANEAPTIDGHHSEYWVRHARLGDVTVATLSTVEAAVSADVGRFLGPIKGGGEATREGVSLFVGTRSREVSLSDRAIECVRATACRYLASRDAEGQTSVRYLESLLLGVSVHIELSKDSFKGGVPGQEIRVNFRRLSSSLSGTFRGQVAAELPSGALGLSELSQAVTSGGPAELARRLRAYSTGDSIVGGVFQQVTRSQCEQRAALQVQLADSEGGAR